MKTFGKPAAAAGNNNADRANSATTGAKTRPAFDLVKKDVDDEGKPILTKITGLFKNVSKAGKVYYSGTIKETGEKLQLYPVEQA